MGKAVLLLTMVLALVLCGCQGNIPAERAIQDPGGSPVQDDGDIFRQSSGNTEPEDTAAPAGETVSEAAEEAKKADGSVTHGTAEDLTGAAAGDLIEIKEKMFIAQTNDVYFNTEDYLGKTLKYEGIFCEYTDPQTGLVYYSVIRYGPGCCGVDANAGFEVSWGQDAQYPEPDDWVEAVGVLEEYEEDGFMYLRLDLQSLTVLDVRGEEYVSQ
ncbi:MAG: hypothetical protein LBQ15_01410 [Clostridium sp.]|jgi:uncharacterized membrane protein YcgQ (UPF0703/DUF1980 family)|nr:hypothetical protein [Clostridium sp.]